MRSKRRYTDQTVRGELQSERAGKTRVDLSVYSGQHPLGTVRRLLTRRFLAIDTNGKRVGVFETQIAAMRALPSTTEQPKKKPARGMHPRGPEISSKGAPSLTTDRARTASRSA